jgi:hypothetical protein
MTLPLLVLDWETYFHSKAGYTLKKMTTEHYVRSELFNAHMLGYWAPDTMPAPAECSGEMPLENADLRRRIETSACLFHHGQFDALILSHWYGLKPGFIYDTLAMARLVLPRLKSHSLGALAQYFGLPEKNVPYNLFDGLRHLPPNIYAMVADGCRHDVWLTKQIFDRLLPYVPEEELQVIDTTVRMFSEPVLDLDRPRMETFLKAEKIRKAKAMLAAGDVIGLPFKMRVGEDQRTALIQHLDVIETELQSSAKFKTALEALGYECPMKWSEKAAADCPVCKGEAGHVHSDCGGTGKTKGGWIPAIAKSDEPMKELSEHDDSRVQALAAARLGVKSTIDETRAQRLLDTDSRGPLPVYLAYAAAKTLRFGGGDKTNWQNFRRGGEIRKSIVAPEGHKLVIGDLSQIEYRLLCWLTGQTDKLDALAAGRDLYSELAGQFYGYEVSKALPKERGLGKQITLSCGYGAGADSIQATAKNGTYGPPLQLTDPESLKARDLYRSTHPNVVQFWDWCSKTALPALHHGQSVVYGHILNPILTLEDHKIWLPNDTAIEYEGLRWARPSELFPNQQHEDDAFSWWEPSRKGYTRTWGSHVTADVCQALAAVVIKHIMVRMKARGWRAVLQCHDELVFCVPDADVERCKADLDSEMTFAPAWCADIPLACEIISSQEYSK